LRNVNLALVRSRSWLGSSFGDVRFGDLGVVKDDWLGLGRCLVLDLGVVGILTGREDVQLVKSAK
jgi:hypothetical protein